MVSISGYSNRRTIRVIGLAWGIILMACSISSRLVATPTVVPPTTAVELPQPSIIDASPSVQPTDTQTFQPINTPTSTVEISSTATPTEDISLPPGTQDFPDPQDVVWQLIVRDLDQPIGLVNAGDGSGRLFVIERPGRIRIILDNILLPEPFLDIHNRVGSSASEQGLLGLAFHPHYMQNGNFFVNYTDLDGNTVIARFQVTQVDPQKADASSEERLLMVEQPYRNHNGGGMAFGPDGYLYLGLGDGGSSNDPAGNAQALTTHLGKILRLDVDSAPGYSIPADNPFLGSAAQPEIWAYGLRNPWRFSFDRLSGDLFIGDVGQNAWEEINYLPTNESAGVNFGWDYREGMHSFEGQIPAGVVVIDPVGEYDHSQGCSVTGGYLYRGEALPAWQGVYVFGDYCSGLVWGLMQKPDQSWNQKLLFETGARITSFGEDESGEIYLVDYNGGIYQLTPAER